MDVQLPDGRILTGVPEGTTKEQIAQKLGMSTGQPPAVPGKPLVQEQERGLLEKAGRGVVDVLASRPVGLTARSLIKGTTLLPGMAIDAVQTIGNKITGSNAPTFSQNVEGALNAYLPKPENSAERVVGDVAESVVGVGGLAGAAQKVGARLGVPAARNFLANNVGTQAASAATSAGASSTAGEMGASVPVQIAAGIAGGFAVPSPRAAVPKGPRLTAEETRARASRLYQAADQAGGTLKPDVTNRFLDEIGAIPVKDDIARQLGGKDFIAEHADVFNSMRGQPLTLDRANAIDQRLTDLLDGETLFGKPTQNGRQILLVREKLRDIINNADPNDTISGNSEGFDTLKAARAEWAKAARLRDPEAIITKALQMEVPATSIRSGFTTLYNNPKRMMGFNSEERAAIKRAATTGLLTGSLKFLGGRLIPIAAGASAFASPALALQAAGVAAASYGARNAASKMQMNKANAVLDLISQRGTGPNVDPGTNRLSALLAKSQGATVGTYQGSR